MPPLKLKRVSWFTANTLAAVVLILLLAAVGCWVLPSYIGRSGPGR